MLEDLIKDLDKLKDPQRARNLQRFFKTGKGQYGYGDIFMGLTVPQSRLIVAKYEDLPLVEISKLLKSKFHEQRLVALLILVARFQKTNNKGQKAIFEFYLKSTKFINNWDLVDLSAPKITGAFIVENPSKEKILDKMAKSADLWERRIAILSTAAFIQKNSFKKTLEISQVLIKDKHDLIHKAVGWMLREVGKKDQKVLEQFLNSNIKILPRTTLRYAIERFPEPLRQAYLKKN